MGHSDIDSVYYSDILSAHYFVYLGVCNEAIIENQEDKQEFMNNARKYSFDRMDKIAFQVPKDQEVVTIYVQPKESDAMYLVVKKHKNEQKNVSVNHLDLDI